MACTYCYDRHGITCHDHNKSNCWRRKRDILFAIIAVVFVCGLLFGVGYIFGNNGKKDINNAESDTGGRVWTTPEGYEAKEKID